MAETIRMSKSLKVLCLIGSILLIIMAVFHGSGYSYISEAIRVSNAEGFLKEIVPALFAHPSIHLLGLATFGILTLFLAKDAKKVWTLLSILILTDAALAFYLGGIIPGIILVASALCFVIVSWKNKTTLN